MNEDPSNDDPSDWREARRLRAFDLKEDGWMQKDIAEALGVSEGAVSQWMKRARSGGGKEALRTRKPPGRPPDLSEEQLKELPTLLKKEPEHFGFRGKVWTRSRIGEVIRRVFGVEYSESHVGRLLRKIDWSPQKPTSRASQRDEEAIEDWIEDDWPRIKKKPEQKAEP